MPTEPKSTNPAKVPAVRAQLTLRQLFGALTIFGLYFATIPLFGLEMLWLGPPLLIAMVRWYGFLRTWEAVTLAILVLLVTVWALPAPTGKGTNHSGQCRNQLLMISLALQNYHDDHGGYPPPVTYHTTGRPMHSWRILIAPYVERADLKSAYEMNEPWNGPANSLLNGQRVRTFQCPSDAVAKKSNSKVSYLAVILPSAKPGDPFPVIEVPDCGINFLEPRDVHLADLLPGPNGKSKLTITAKHSSGQIVHVAWPDGMVERIPLAELPTRLQEFEAQLPEETSELPPLK